jgi:hypothetical protein
MDVKKLIDLRKEAEKAVAEMPDGDLKLKAFEVILNHLISASVPRPRTQTAGATEHTPATQPSEDFPAKSVAGRIMVLKEEGFFKNPKVLAEIREELQAHGWRYPNATIAPILIKLVEKKVLRRQRIKEGNARPWKYFNP